MKRLLVISFALFAAQAWAQELPAGPGREETLKLCGKCHEVARSVSLRQDRDGWQLTMTKMTAFGMQASGDDLNTVLDYLSKHYPADVMPPLNVNEATAIQLESRLSLRRSQSAAVIAYRDKNGKFKSIEDLKKVPGIDAAKIEAKKDRIVF